MIKSRLLFLPLALLAFCAAPLLRAAEAAKYRSAGQPDPIVLLAPPPVPGSAEDVTDMESAFRVYSAATPAERDRLARECDRRATAFALAGQDR